ncbi:hypothetical protein GCM10022265_28130 [Marinobacter xestospongiae]
MHEFRIDMSHLRNSSLELGKEFLRTERRERRSAAKFQHGLNLYRASLGIRRVPPIEPEHLSI